MVISSSSVSDPANSSALLPLYPLLTLLLSSWSSPLLQRPPPPPLLLTCLWPCLPSSFSTVVLLLAVVVLPPVSASPRDQPVSSLFLPPSLMILSPSSLGPLLSLTLPHAPFYQALAFDIAHREEDVGDWTGGVVARWLVAGRSAPRGKCPSRPFTVVGDGISRPLFLHLPQQ